MPDFDFRGYDAWKCDSGREGEREDRSYQLVVCPKGHRRLVRDRDKPGICWTCQAWEPRPNPRKE
jgi:hypothetical protein